MKYRLEPPYHHGSAARTGVLLVNLGTPASSEVSDVRRYLAEFLSDPRVVEIPRPLWWLILHGIILRLRPRKSAQKYASIWTPQGSPLAVWTKAQAQLLERSLGNGGHDVVVKMAMRYGSPAIAATLDELKRAGVTRVLVLPLYPQYAGATTASVSDAVHAWSRSARTLPEFRFVNHFHDDAGYIDALAESVQAHWRAKGRGERLLVSFHGVPRRSLLLGDPYHCECQVTARLLAQALGLGKDEVVVAFQSRLGRARWLEPYTEATLKSLARDGVRHVDVICPGFPVDCLETLEEIAIEGRETFLKAGGERFEYIACLNDGSAWIDALAALATRHLQGWATRLVADDAALPRQRERALRLGATD